MRNDIWNLLFYVDKQKLNELNEKVFNFVNNNFSGVIGGIFLLFLIMIVAFSFISNSSRK